MANFSFVFPGQGSQSVGMLKELSEAYPVIKSTFAEASEVLGYDLFDLVMNGPAEELGKTFKTQPALLTASVALYRLWQDAVRLVKLRGEFMQAAVPAGVGAMAAVIGLADDVVISACADAAGDQVCSAVNFNSPGQVVIAGNKEAVEKAGEILKNAGAKRVLPLAVSVPSHCALMKSAADELAKELAKTDFKTPEIPVINNVDVAVQNDPEAIKDALIRQLYSPVRWVETVQKLSAEGIKTAVEVGPGKVLAGLIKRIDKEINAISMNDAATLDAALAAVAE